ncbi:MAG: hypothetical protein ABWZ25_00690 [Chitinophagaceae bacterium]
MKTRWCSIPCCVVVLGGVLLQVNCKKEKAAASSDPPPVISYNVPPSVIQEDWKDHTQQIFRMYYDSTLAVYFDKEVDKTITWPNTFINQVWQYTKKTYGYEFGPDQRLYAVFHTGKYAGGHPGYYYSSEHGNRNVIDCGSNNSNAWITGTGNDLDLVTHEVGHIVESATNGAKGSPAFPIWKDSKWMEIYIYDVYKNLGRTADAERWFNLCQGTVDPFPRANTQWFKNWFYPIYSQHGGKEVLSRFFKLVAIHFPKNSSRQFTRDMNWGEFIHFWSGAAGTNLKTLATDAFGWPDEWETMFNKARTDFPGFTY